MFVLIQTTDNRTEVMGGAKSESNLCFLGTQSYLLRDLILPLPNIINSYHIYSVNGMDVLFVYNDLGPSCIDVFYGV